LPLATGASRVEQALLQLAEELSCSGSWAWDPASGRVVWSPNLYRLFDREPAQEPPALIDIMAQVHADDRPLLVRALDQAEPDGGVQEVAYRRRTEQGTVRFMRSVVAARAGADGSNMYVGWLQDITDMRHGERAVAAHLATSQALAEWDGFSAGAERLLQALAAALGFEHAVLWVPEDDVLVPKVTCFASGAEALAAFTAQRRPARGTAMAGVAWEAGEPVSLVPGSDSQVQQEHRRHGVRGGLAIPLFGAGETVGVLALMGSEQPELTDTLRATLVGIGHQVGTFLAARAGDLRPHPLSARQLEILQLAAEGLTGAEIARRLEVSPATVKSHFETIYARYEVPDRVAAVAKALREGLIR